MDGRRIAYEILEGLAGRRIATVAAGIAAGAWPKGREQAFARELCLGCQRYQRLYDYLAGRFLHGGEQPTPLLLALRIGCHQLFALDRVPPHAAVSTSVGLLGRGSNRRWLSVANAVLRKLAELRREHPDESVTGPERWLVDEAVPADPALRFSVPDALAEDLQPVLGDDPARWAGINTLPHLATRGQLHGWAGAAGIIKNEGDWTWWSQPQQALRGPVLAGTVTVQDPGQASLVQVGAPRPGELVLDLCAAPGGKTTLLQELGCQVISGDRSIAKVRRLPAGRRLVQDGRQPALADAFDLVLVDVPCSNTGVLGRRPEARWRYDAKSCASLAAVQRDLLQAASRLVRPGGRLLYTTCSIVPAENDGRIAELDGWRVVDDRLNLPNEWQGGGYAALLIRS